MPEGALGVGTEGAPGEAMEDESGEDPEGTASGVTERFEPGFVSGVGAEGEAPDPDDAQEDTFSKQPWVGSWHSNMVPPGQGRQRDSAFEKS
mmetsp:Transcript_28717/g.60396  ORF Transcript_28717/g.60396 Transcript_28717/m.60396 type:complete len:92 (-) Transcript_28717:623-898(-)